MKIADKLAKVNENWNVNMYDNGYMIEVSGRDHYGEWSSAKIIVPTVEELLTLVSEACSLPRE